MLFRSLNVLKDVSHTPKDAYILERLGVHYVHNGGGFSSLLMAMELRSSVEYSLFGLCWGYV